MAVLQDSLAIPLPKIAPVRQLFHAPKVENIEKTIKEQMNQEKIRQSIRPGARVVVGVGSRGIANLQKIVHTVIQELISWGAFPFIVPAMGSHGGGTGEGQIKVLSELGITEDVMGVPIVSKMEVVQIGQLPGGVPVYLDQEAYGADAIIFLNRVKPHTSFKGNHESGLLKMMSIGLGRHQGALAVHERPLAEMPQLLPALAEVYLTNAPIAFGIGILENAYDETANIVAVPAGELIERDQELLIMAKEYMARLLPPKIDVLIVSELGKNISGSGMDPNITGRAASKAPQKFNAPPIERIVVLGLTKETKGNACGIGVADVITRKAFEEVNMEYTYANVITSKVLDSAKIPVVMPSDRDAIRVALKTCYQADSKHPRIVWIKNTLELETIWVSEAVLSDMENSPLLEVMGDPVQMDFDPNGHLLNQAWIDRRENHE